MTKTVNGKPCKVCGSTERYASTNRCIPCARAKQIKWNAANMSSVLKTQKRLKNEKYAKDDNWRKSMIVLSMMRQSIHKKNFSRNLELIVGYSGYDLKRHLESTWEPGMTWDNYGKGEGKWCIDHIHSISRTEDFKKLWALSNLRAKWFIPNIVRFHQEEI